MRETEIQPSHLILPLFVTEGEGVREPIGSMPGTARLSIDLVVQEAREVWDLGVPAVRFNFRGVGASEGQFADGIGETDDVLAVIDWALDRYNGAELCLMGFSFGGTVACRAALTARPSQLVTVAPAVSGMERLLNGAQPDCPWLIVQGAADEIVSCDALVEWVNGLAPGPELIVLPDVGHFFHGNLTVLRETVVAHLGANWSTV